MKKINIFQYKKSLVIIIIALTFLLTLSAEAKPNQVFHINVSLINSHIHGSLKVTLIDKDGDGDFDHWTAEGELGVGSKKPKKIYKEGHFGIVQQPGNGTGFNLPNNLPITQILSAENFRLQIDYNDFSDATNGDTLILDTLDRIGFGFEVHNGVPDTLYGSFMKPFQYNTTNDSLMLYYPNQSLSTLWNFGSVILNEPDTIISPKVSILPGDVDFINIFPNPANDLISIFNFSEYNSIEIYNTDGKLVLSIKYNSNNTSLDISRLPNGVYYLNIETSAGMNRRKFIINR
jgi:hypothetical protein